MSNDVGNVRAVVLAWAFAGLIGAVAAGLLMVLAGWDFSPAAFVGLLLAALIGGIVTWAARPLPSFGDSGAEQRARAAGAGALAAAAAPAMPASAHGMPAAAHAMPASAHAMPAAAHGMATAAHAMPAMAAAPVPPGVTARPAMLTAARGGVPDDLKVIKGIGPRLEKMLHGMGVYHFDQIAAWQAAELAWVDDNLEGFRGRASRDRWIEQARILAAGGSVDDFVAPQDGATH